MCIENFPETLGHTIDRGFSSEHYAFSECFNVEVTGTERLYRATSVWTARLCLGLLGALNGNENGGYRNLRLKSLNYLFQLNPRFRLKPKAKTNSVCIGTQA